MLYQSVTGEMAVKKKLWQGSSYKVLCVLAVIMQLAKSFIVEVSLPKKGNYQLYGMEGTCASRSMLHDIMYL